MLLDIVVLLGRPAPAYGALLVLVVLIDGPSSPWRALLVILVVFDGPASAHWALLVILVRGRPAFAHRGLVLDDLEARIVILIDPRRRLPCRRWCGRDALGAGLSPGLSGNAELVLALGTEDQFPKERLVDAEFLLTAGTDDADHAAPGAGHGGNRE
jgi:hypothetical protein